MSTRPLTCLCLLYLLLPCLLFLGGWIHPWLAWPVGLLLTGATSWVAYQCPVQRLHWSPAGAARLALLLVLGAIWVETIGLDGLVNQSGDCTVRNAIYASLVRENWPLTVAGESFIYYLGCWLPPALLAKWGVPAAAALHIWVLLGVWLALLAISAGKGTRKALIFLIFLLLLGDAMNWVNRIYFKLIQGSRLDVFQDWTLFFDLQYTPSCVQLRNTFNHYLAPLLVLGMRAGKLLPARYSLVAGALVLICSPLAAVALLPLLLIQAGWQAMNRVTLAAVPYVALPLLYMAGGAGSQLAWLRPAGDCCLAGLSTAQLLARYALQLVCIGFPAWFFLRKWKHTAWWYCAWILAAGLPLVWIGMWNNEFLFKGAAILWFCLAWLYTSAWEHAKRNRRVLLTLFLLLSASDAYGQLMGAIKSFSCNPVERKFNIRDEWQGELHQPGDSRAAQFHGKPLLPQIFKFATR